MFKKVLVPTDFSRYAQKVLGCLGGLPGLKEVVLLNVLTRNPAVEIWDPVTLVSDAEKKVLNEGRHIKIPGIAVKPRAIINFDGDIASMIGKVADQENADLIVMGVHGWNPIRSIIQGSASRRLLNFGNRNLLIMRYKLLGSLERETFESYCRRIFSKVLIPTDLSEPSKAAVSFIQSIPGLREVMLLHVIPDGDANGRIDARTSNAKEHLDGMAEGLRKVGINVIPHIAVGNVAKEINAISGKEDVSLIAMSSHGMTSSNTNGIGRRIHNIVNLAERPVLVIRYGAISG